MKSKLLKSSIFVILISIISISLTNACNCSMRKDFRKTNLQKTEQFQIFQTKEDLLKAYPNCKNATNGVNKYFGENLNLSTRIMEPEGFIPKWKCLNSRKINNENIKNKEGKRKNKQKNTENKNRNVKNKKENTENKSKNIKDKKLTIKENKVCTMEYSPVCGKNGKTYNNRCNAKISNIDISYKGKCNNMNKLKNEIDITGKKLRGDTIKKLNGFLGRYNKKMSKMNKKKFKKINNKVISFFNKKRSNINKNKYSGKYNAYNYLIKNFQLIGENINNQNNQKNGVKVKGEVKPCGGDVNSQCRMN